MTLYRTRALALKHPYLFIGAAAALTHFAVALWRMSGGYFAEDDFLNFEYAVEPHGALRYLFQDVFHQVVPLHRAVNWLLIHTLGLNYAGAAVVLALTSSSTIALIVAIAARARASISVTAACAFAAAVGWVTIDSFGWWSAGLHTIPAAFFVAAALWVCAKPAPSLRVADRLAVAAFLVAACGFANAACLGAILGGACRLFVIRSLDCNDDKSNALQREALAFWRAFLELTPAILGIVAMMGAVFLATKTYGNQYVSNVPPITFTTMRDGVALGAQFGWLGGAVGPRITSDTPAWLTLLGAILINGIVGVLVWQSCRLNQRVIWIWLGLITFAIATLALVTYLRAGVYGPWVVAKGRYGILIVMLTWATVMVAYGRAYNAKATSAFHHHYVALIACVILLSQIVGAARHPESFNYHPIRQFVQATEASAARLPRGSSVAERQLPSHIVLSWQRPFNDLSHFAPILDTPFPVAAWNEATHYLDDAGVLHAFADLPVETFDDAGQRLDLHIVPAFFNVGFLDHVTSDYADGWFNPLFAPPEEIRIAMVSRGRVISWANRIAREDLEAAFMTRDIPPAGFIAQLPSDLASESVRAIAIIDGRIGVVLPRS